MVRKCVVPNCDTTMVAGNGVLLHVFPLTNSVRLNKWLEALRIPGFMPKSNNCVCSLHFKLTDYTWSSIDHQMRLNSDAIPSIFGGGFLCKGVPIKRESPPASIEDIKSDHAYAMSGEAADLNAFPNDHTSAPEKTKHRLKSIPENITLRIESAVKNEKLTIESSPRNTKLLTKSTPENRKRRYKVSANERRRRIVSNSPEVKTLRLQISALQQHKYRQEKKLQRLSNLIGTVGEKAQLSEDAFRILKTHFAGISQELFKCDLGNLDGSDALYRIYSEDLKDFAQTIQQHSPRGYEFVRSFIALPECCGSISNLTLPLKCDLELAVYDVESLDSNASVV